MVLTEASSGTVALCEREIPVALPGEVLVRVRACGVCANDLQIVDGARPDAEIPVVPGHEIVGVVELVGDGVTGMAVGARVGISWLGHACGICTRCASGCENLCAEARFTGLHMDGGFAEYAVADAGYMFALPQTIGDADAAPLLCAGAIAYRAYRMTGSAGRLGIYGDDPAADLIAQIATHQQRVVHRFADGATGTPPASLDAAIVVGGHGGWLPRALSQVGPGGIVVCTGPATGEVPSFPFGDLAEDRAIRSVTNATRDDVRELLALADRSGIRTRVQTYALADAQQAIDDVRDGRVDGAAVLTL
jgi:alcohol dehydrogenase, propanol-preferring